MDTPGHKYPNEGSVCANRGEGVSATSLPPSAGELPRRAELGRQSWAGLVWRPIEVIGETPKRYRVRYPSGLVSLVPKTAVRFLQ